MREAYLFLRDIEAIAIEYFFFFYKKRLFDFENIKIRSQSQYEKIRGERTELKGKERDFENIFYHIIRKYNSLGIDKIELYIDQIENIMLSTDLVGRNAIARRIIKLIGPIFFVGKYGIIEMMDYLYSDKECLFYRIYNNILKIEIKEGEEGYEVPENLRKISEILKIIPEMMEKFILFTRNFKMLCVDFDVDYPNIVETLGFSSLNEIIQVHSRYGEKWDIKDNTRKNDFTNNRKRIAIEALLGGLNIKRGALGNVSSAEMYRFAHLITGRGTKEQKADNLPTKDMFSNKPKSKEIKEKDNYFVAEYFQKLGLNDIAEEIKKGIYD